MRMYFDIWVLRRVDIAALQRLLQNLKLSQGLGSRVA